MPINVVCPGCLKRFQVGDQFAGKRGPCPNCKTIIEIPKEQVVIHAPDEFVSGGKTVKGRAILKPITRLNTDFKPRDMIIGAVCALLVVVACVIIGKFKIDPSILNWIGFFGLLLITFPLCLFGHQLLREGDDLEIIDGSVLYKKTALCAAIFAVCWVCFEYLAKYMGTDGWFILIYLAPIVFFSIAAVHVLFAFDFGRGFLYYLVFFVPVVLLRGLIGLGWIWNAISTGSSGSGPPPPPPPIM